MAAEIVGAAIAAGASLAGTSISSISANGPLRNIVVEITNRLSDPLVLGNWYLDRGENSVPPTNRIMPMTMEVARFDKYPGTASGANGLLSYKIESETTPISFVVNFSVPFNYNHCRNWFGLEFVSNGTWMNKDFHTRHYYHSAWKSPETGIKFAYADETKPITVYNYAGKYELTATMRDDS